MTIEIKITAHQELGDVAKQVNEAMAALGFVRALRLISSTATIDEDVSIGEALAPGTGFTADEINAIDKAAEDFYAAKPAPARVPGQPSPGKARRTKAEIAEDEAAAKASHDRVAAIKEDVLAGATGQQTAYDTPEDAAQDAADEAAETAANKTGLTLDDLRHAAARYQKKFGMAAAVAGIPTLLGCAMVDVPEADLAAAIAKIDAAVTADAPGAIEEKVAEVKAATKEDVMAAMLRYALNYDGQDKDMNAMPKTMADAPKIFAKLFGADVVKLSQVPADGYAKTVAAFDEAIAKNPFQR